MMLGVSMVLNRGWDDCVVPARHGCPTVLFWPDGPVHTMHSLHTGAVHQHTHQWLSCRKLVVETLLVTQQ
jgi:hypothetical protein